MPRTLNPTLLAFTGSLVRGSLSTIPDPLNNNLDLTLAFQYNPETITRTRTGTWESKSQKKGQSTPTQQQATANTQRGAGLYVQSETISFKLTLDATELVLSGAEDAQYQGIWPELGILEQMSVGTDSTQQSTQQQATSKDGLTAVRANDLLLVLGPRVFPVVMTSMTITEQRFNTFMIPVRADIDLKFRVLENTEVDGDQSVVAAFKKLMSDRQASSAVADYPVDPVAAALRSSGGGT
jgi:hypothetical protein